MLFLCIDFGDCTSKFLDYILSGLGTIITFGLGLYSAYLIDTNKENRELKKLYNYFVLYWDVQKEKIVKQIGLFKKIQEDINKLIDTSGLSIESTTQPYYMLDALNKQSLLHAWEKFSKKNTEELFDYLQYIESTRINLDHHKTYHSNFLLRQAEVRTKWNTAITAFHDLMVILFNKPKEEIKKDRNLMKLNEIYNKWGDNFKEDFEYTINHLTQPILEHFNEVYGNNPSDPIASILLRRTSDLSLAYKEWKASIESYKTYLNSVVEKFEDKKLKVSFTKHT